MAFDEAAADTVVEKELSELFETAKPTATAEVVGDESKPITPKPDAKVPPVASPEASEKTDADDLLAKLDAIEEDKPAEVKPDDTKPALTEDQKTVLEAIPTPQVLENLRGQLTAYNNFTSLLENQKFDGVEAELEHWNPDVLEGWFEHVYKTKVMSGEWIDRYLAEAKGEGKSKDVRKLEKEVSDLKKMVVGKQTEEATNTAQQKLTAALNDFTTHVDGLFDRLEFNPADRRWVQAALNIEIAKDPKLLAAIRGGNAKAVTPLFKKVAREYVTRDKQVTETVDKKIAAQEQKKMPLAGGAAGGVDDSVPEDIKDVKKGDAEGREKWLDRALGSFLGKVKK